MLLYFSAPLLLVSAHFFPNTAHLLKLYYISYWIDNKSWFLLFWEAYCRKTIPKNIGYIIPNVSRSCLLTACMSLLVDCRVIPGNSSGCSDFGLFLAHTFTSNWVDIYLHLIINISVVNYAHINSNNFKTILLVSCFNLL